MAKNIYTSYEFNGNQITGVADGVNADDVSTKGQLDAGIAEAKAYADDAIANIVADTIRYEVTSLTLNAGVPEDIVHNLGNKYVQVTLVDALDDNRVDLDVNFVDNNTIRVVSNTTVTVNGVISV